MNTQTIMCCVVALILGMLLANMLKNVCGCKLVEGQMTGALCDSKDDCISGNCGLNPVYNDGRKTCLFPGQTVATGAVNTIG
jgi:hypothetical protein